jgi:hypothetical protein
MKKIKQLSVAVALGATTVLAGCGGISLGLPGSTASFGVGSPISSLRVAPSSCLLTGGAYGHRLGMNAAAIAGERMQQIQRYSAKFGLYSSDVRVVREGWRSIAEGGC